MPPNFAAGLTSPTPVPIGLLPTSTPGNAAPGPSADVLNFEEKLLNQSAVPVKPKETRIPALPSGNAIGKLPEEKQKGSPEALKRASVAGAYFGWKETCFAFYKNIKNNQQFQDFENKPFAMTQFTDLAKFLSLARSQTDTLITTISTIPGFTKPSVFPKDFKFPDFSTTKWINDRVGFLDNNVSLEDLAEADLVLNAFQKYLASIFDQIVPIFEKIKIYTFDGLKHAFDCDRHSATCLKYLDTNQKSVPSITVVDLLNLVKSYICNIMNNISDRKIRINADTACKLEKKFELVYDVFRYLAFRDVAKPTNSREFCELLIESLAKTTQELKEAPESRLLFSLNDAKRDLLIHFGGAPYENMVQIVTNQANATTQQFNKILDARATRPEVLNLLHVMIVGILLQMCDMVSAEAMKVWLQALPTQEFRGRLTLDQDQSQGYWESVKQATYNTILAPRSDQYENEIAPLSF